MGSNAPPSAGGLPVEAQLMSLLMGGYTLQMLATAVRMGIFDQLSEEPTPAETLAEHAGTLPDPTYRLMRALSVIGALVELPDRRCPATRFISRPTTRRNPRPAASSRRCVAR